MKFRLVENRTLSVILSASDATYGSFAFLESIAITSFDKIFDIPINHYAFYWILSYRPVEFISFIIIYQITVKL